MDVGYSRLLIVTAFAIASHSTAITHVAAGQVDRAETARYSLEGRIYDNIDSMPLPGAVITWDGAKHRIESDEDGRFSLDSLGTGDVTIVIARLGYDTTSLRFPLPQSGALQLYLRRQPVAASNMVVLGSGVSRLEEPGAGRIVLNAEHLRHAPGSLDDVSRAVSRLPSVTPLYDVLNIYSVRGGGPHENGFSLDGIILPDINHLPSQGGTGGAVGLINLDLVESARLQTGAFDAAFGGYLSSMLDLEWRAPRSDRIGGELDFSVAGLNVDVEGPLGPRVGFLASIRHSYLDDLLDDTDLPLSPQFDDYQGRLDVVLGTGHRLSLVGLLGVDHFNASQLAASNAGNGAYFGKWDATPHMVGLSLESVWSPSLVSRTSIAHTGTTYDYNFLDLSTADSVYVNRSTESATALRHDVEWALTGRRRVFAGIDLRLVSTNIHNKYYYFADRYGVRVGLDTLVADDRDDLMPSAYVSYQAPVGNQVTVTTGVHTRYFARTEQSHIEPRVRVEWTPFNQLRLDLAGGVVHQPMPYTLMAQDSQFRRLRESRAFHLGGGAAVNLGSSMTFQFELYRKWYDYMPMDRRVPAIYVLDEILSRDSFRFELHDDLVERGRAASQGVELMLQRDADHGVYGNVSVSFSDAKYRGLDGVWYERALDVEHAEAIDFGYRSRNGWVVTVSWRSVGGLRYTDYLRSESNWYNVGVVDADNPNSEQLPRLHWMDVRAEKCFPVGFGDLSAYVGVWNAYNSHVTTTYLWSTEVQYVVYDSQLERLPVVGLIYRY